MKKAQKLTIELIRYEIFGIPVDEEILADFNEELAQEVYTVAVRIDMGYIVASALSKLNLLLPEAKAAFFNEQLATIFRYEQLKYDLESICELFEKEGIEFIPLKGSVIRNYYPKPEMRTSCDIDILIHPQSCKKASALFEDKLGFVYADKSEHDVSFNTPAQTKVELHHTLFDHDYKEKDQLDRVWDNAQPIENSKYAYEMDTEFFMFYHIVHMVYHIRTGGCGIRPFLDLKILEEKLQYDKTKLTNLLDKAYLTECTNQIFDIADIWFGTKKDTELSELMAEYIFDAGAYGSIENQVAKKRSKNNSALVGILSRFIVSHRELKTMYPQVKKYPFLNPMFQVHRWFRIIFKDKAKKQMSIIKENFSLDEDKLKNVSKLMDYLGL